MSAWKAFLILIATLVAVSALQGQWARVVQKVRNYRSESISLRMVNAFESPSVITRQKRDEVMNDPFESPSALINGGAGTKESKLALGDGGNERNNHGIPTYSPPPILFYYLTLSSHFPLVTHRFCGC